eukprot:CAMPEP_0201118888 /NCGR_PEP_ID=MMETSP0850-20130426/3085_1 /ASSEMBLY_ACC=CAM_ASM_000622 /TAXON_ID=183588 /ORGANISM="Pseudo-nitzschia fraudulenta, Strain WWA7" /LENGTH=303 /DNA_ID=CAMNT_0047384371 /DNA_START=167 /DNA_END=1078 /DNA_ORIENTATION=-
MLSSPILPIDLTRKHSASINIINNNNNNNNGHSQSEQPKINILTFASSSSTSSKKRPRTSLSSSSSFDNLSADTIHLLRSIHPSDYARSAFRANGFGDFEPIVGDCEQRFLAPTAAMLEAYNTEILDAVRNNDLSRAKQLYGEGAFQHGCNACNRFGESILHIACRRGHLAMVRFLIDEVGLSCTTIRDDYHRTPLHDAFWTSTASYDVVDYLLKLPNVTELLLCKDKRGFTPLDYSRGEDRGKWLRFLWERRSELKPASKQDEIIVVPSTSTTATSNDKHRIDQNDERAKNENPFKRQRIMG